MYQESATDFGKVRLTPPTNNLSPQEVPGIVQLLLEKVNRLEARITRLSRLLEESNSGQETATKDVAKPGKE